MTNVRWDAFVVFGAAGDLAYKKIFPALQAIAKRGHLDVPVIGVAKSGWTRDAFRARARDSVEQHGGLDARACDTLAGLLCYVDGDYRDPATFQGIRKQLGPAQRPAYYLAIPPTMFGLVVEQSANPAALPALASSSRSPSAVTSRRRRRSTARCSAALTRRRSFGSTITSASGRCTTCCSSASPTRGQATDRHSDRSAGPDRKSTRLNSSHSQISYAVFCLK